MKTLLRHLSPFAPDNSGAVSVLFEFGGLIAICDAGGCTGNVCGFDEPRWFTRKSAVFSAGLRDMDAILGRDDKLAAKLQDAMEGSGFAFSAVIGTPVPAVIATDFQALKRLLERRTGRPALTLETTGTRLCDRGEETAWLELFKTFATERRETEKGTLGVIGVTPMEFSALDAGEKIAAVLRAQGWKKVCCYGMGAGLDAVREAARAEKNLVVAPAGRKAALYLRDTFGTPLETGCPFLPGLMPEPPEGLAGKKTLVVHQQFLADAVRRRIGGTSVDVGTWFMTVDDLKKENDWSIAGESDFAETVARRGYEVIVGDLRLKRALRNFPGEFIDFPHFAVSGRLTDRRKI